MKGFKHMWMKKFDTKEGSDWFQILAIFLMSLSSLSLGASFTWVSPTIPILISEEYPGNITLEEASYLTVIPPIACIIGSPIFSYVMDAFGRKKSLLLLAIPNIISWIIVMNTESIYVFYLSRFINGFADSCYFVVLPTYMSEIASPSVRGSWGNVPTLAIYFGQFLINAVGGYCTIKTTAYIFVTIPIAYLATFWKMPESPYYLLMKSQQEEARNSLRILRSRDDVEEELKQLTADVKRQTGEAGSWRELFANPTHRKAFMAGTFIRAAQQYSGIAAFSTYTVYLFQEVGADINSTVAAMGFFLFLTVMNTMASCILDKIGRRLSMIFSCAACAAILLVVSTFLYLKEFTDLDLSSIKWLPIAAMMVYVFVYSIGLGIVPTLIIGELFSTSIKAKGVCVLNVAFSIYVTTSTKIFQYLMENCGLYSPFLLFFACCLISAIVSYYIVPETKGKTLEEIQQSMKN